MPRQKAKQARDRLGDTRQKHAARVKRQLVSALGPLPEAWDLLASWPDGLDRDTWRDSTHFWRIQHVAHKTSGQFYGHFRPDQVELAHKWALQLARAVGLGYEVVPTGDTMFTIYEPLLSGGDASPQPHPEEDRVPLVRMNEACDQFNPQAAELGIATQKYDSFRRWCSRQGVRRHRIGATRWVDVEHLNEVMRAVYGERAPTFRAGNHYPVVKRERAS